MPSYEESLKKERDKLFSFNIQKRALMDSISDLLNSNHPKDKDRLIKHKQTLVSVEKKINASIKKIETFKEKIAKGEIREERRDFKNTASLESKMKGRYRKLLEVVKEAKPKIILEVGTWKGQSACSMLHEAQKHNKKVHYIGYDLFESGDEATHKEELNIKRTRTKKEVEKTLENFRDEMGYDFTFELHKGNTRDILPEIKVDFVFIDGGHSIETIKSDYEKVKKSDYIVFDDYYREDSEGNIPDLSKYGCNAIVDTLDNVEIYFEGESSQNAKIKADTGGDVGIAIVRNKK